MYFVRGDGRRIRKSDPLKVWGGAAQHGVVIIPAFILASGITDSQFRTYCRLATIPHGQRITFGAMCDTGKITVTVGKDLDALCKRRFILPVVHEEGGDTPVGVLVRPIGDILREMFGDKQLPNVAKDKRKNKHAPSDDDAGVRDSVIDPIAICPPVCSPVAWGDWIMYRRTSRHSLNPITLKKQAEFLEKQGAQADECLYQSITNGWMGLFPVKQSVKREVGRILRNQAQQSFEDLI